MADPEDEKQTLKHYLQREREALVWKLDGLSERQARWPVTPTGTNLLGLIKHVANVEYGYFGEVFDRPAADPMLIDFETAGETDDFWARADEPMTEVIAFYRRAWAHADATIDALALDTRGTVPWWPEPRRHPTLHTVLVHHVQELARHAGHADIVRETLDGRVGLAPAVSNLPDHDATWWAEYRGQLERVAESFPEQASDTMCPHHATEYRAITPPRESCDQQHRRSNPPRQSLRYLYRGSSATLKSES